MSRRLGGRGGEVGGVDEFNSTKRNYRREEMGDGGGWWRGGEGGLAEKPGQHVPLHAVGAGSAGDQLAVSRSKRGLGAAQPACRKTASQGR